MTVCSHPEIQEQKQEWAGLPGHQCGTRNTWLIFQCVYGFLSGAKAHWKGCGQQCWCVRETTPPPPLVAAVLGDDIFQCSLSDNMMIIAMMMISKYSNNSWVVFSGWAFLCRVGRLMVCQDGAKRSSRFLTINHKIHIYLGVNCHHWSLKEANS